jgi:hypothetical protein
MRSSILGLLFLCCNKISVNYTNRLLKANTQIQNASLNKQKSLWLLTPISGIILFVGLYFVATTLYPGGSQVDSHSIGFSWANNYWCNLLNEKAINGQPNAAMPVAMAGMFVLCLSLASFWIQFPKHFAIGKFWKRTIQMAGTISMFIGFFLFTNLNHDAVTNFASFFGIIATVGTFAGLYKNKWLGLFAFGLLNVLLVGINNYVYYTKGMIIYLPVIQKITFGSFLIWIAVINLKMYRKAD